MRRRSALLFVALLALTSLTAGCSAGVSASPPVPTVGGAWARASAGGDQPSAAYMTITNPSGQADQLVSASSADAKSVELHQTTTDSSGMTAMHPVAGFPIPAGATITLAPGGLHLMIMGLSRPLVAGGTLQLNLVFESGATVTVQAEVR